MTTQGPLSQSSPADDDTSRRDQDRYSGNVSSSSRPARPSGRSRSVGRVKGSSAPPAASASVHKKNCNSRYRSQVSKLLSTSHHNSNEQTPASTASDKTVAADNRSSVKKVMPFLFDMLDIDNDGCLDRNEVVVGVTRMIKDCRVVIRNESKYLQSIGSIMNKVDADRNGQLDRREFGIFLFELSCSMEVTLDVLAQQIMEVHELHDKNQTQYDTETWNQVPGLFDKWDRNSNNEISRHEMTVAMRKVEQSKLSYTDIMSIFDENDHDGNSTLDLPEFYTFLASFSLASGTPLSDTVAFLEAEADNSTDLDLALEGWKMMPYLFSLFDTDKNGTIERSELVENIGLLITELDLEVTVADVWQMMGDVDENSDGSLDRHEFGFFLSALAKKASLSIDEVTFYLSKLHKEGRSARTMNEALRGWDNMERLFQQWDTDGDGTIDRRELGIGMSMFRHTHECALTPVQYLKIMDEVDDNGDGHLDPREFSAYLSRFALAAGIKLEVLTSHLLECSPSERRKQGKNMSLDLIWNWAESKMHEESLQTVRQVEAAQEQNRIQSEENGDDRPRPRRRRSSATCLGGAWPIREGAYLYT